MSLGLIGRKVGMTRLFSDDGTSVPVTVLQVGGNHVTQIKQTATDGYTAIQLGFGERKANRTTAAQAGHTAKAGVQSKRALKEFKIEDSQIQAYSLGQEIVIGSVFSTGQKVDVTGVTIGKGYAGTIKRHHFKSGRASHGNSRSHNVPGSIGMAQDPGRVFPGKRMTGHLGDVQRTTQNLLVARIDEARGLVMVKGAVAGAPNGQVFIMPAIKAPLKSKKSAA